MGVGAGDEVIVPSNTYIATWLGVSHTRATPVPVEPDPGTSNIDPNQIEKVINPRTKIILPVHLYGQAADMDAILEIARRHDLLLLENSAQARGASYRGRRCGSLGHAAAWSFYSGKSLGAFGDACAITTDDENLADKIRVLRDYGSRTKYLNEVKGFNSRLDSLQGALLPVRLKKLDECNHRRAVIANLYLEWLPYLPDLSLPSVPEWADPCWHLFVIRHQGRDELQRRLAEIGVETLIHYPVPPHRSRDYSSENLESWPLPVAEDLASTVLSLPMGPHLPVENASTAAKTLRLSLQSL
jgi:dTDP-4-amino-4,6-dideoxygalactose transaminase